MSGKRDPRDRLGHIVRTAPPRIRRHGARVGITGVAVAGLFFFTGVVWPHGGDSAVRILGQRTGAYDVTVRTAPKQARVGRLHIEVQLIDPVALAYVDGATVTAVARTADGTTVRAGPAHSRYREPWHEMDLSLTKRGLWDVHLTIDGAQGRGEVSFRVEVSGESSGALPGSHARSEGDPVSEAGYGRERAPVRAKPPRRISSFSP